MDCMRPSRALPGRAHSDWRSSRADAGRKRDDVAEAATVSSALTALRRGREAVVEIDGQLGEVLDWLSDPKPSRQLSRDLPDRMAASSRRASEALTGAAVLLYHDGPAGSELF
jgi:hypothetical protein